MNYLLIIFVIVFLSAPIIHMILITPHIKFKNIKRPDKTTFLIRWSKKCKSGGSWKLHLILNDDVTSHTHPWDFTSFILFGGYVERSLNIYESNSDWIQCDGYSYKEYGWLSINRKKMNVEHQITLRRLFGFKIPAVTIGYYGPKKQLCSLCKEQGYCNTTGKPI